MDLLRGETLVKKDKSEANISEALTDKEVIGFYFSAHWCPPCRGFTPILADFYNELKDKGASFEIIFVSSDRSPDDMFQYMKESHGDWLALSHGSEVASKLKKKYGVQGIPTLVVVKKDGILITKDGRNDVQSMGPRAFKTWLK
ncbi:nucleoredoxin-like protein 2 [Tachypleus tridentatus]|uniref:nucleoredoxin-like protein 2 n=1 Tax=Tachypleus tridentatus TaxID=6853 RepID=UPI003FCF2EF4